MIVFSAVNRPILGYQILKWRCQGLLMATAARWSSIPWESKSMDSSHPRTSRIPADSHPILKNGAFQMGLPPVIWKIGLSWIHEKNHPAIGAPIFQGPTSWTRQQAPRRTTSLLADRLSVRSILGRRRSTKPRFFHVICHHFSIFYMEI